MPYSRIPHATEQGNFQIRISRKSGNFFFAEQGMKSEGPDIRSNFGFARERISARRGTDQVPDQKNLFLGLGNSRLSRSVLPSYSRRKIPRRCNSGLEPLFDE